MNDFDSTRERYKAALEAAKTDLEVLALEEAHLLAWRDQVAHLGKDPSRIAQDGPAAIKVVFGLSEDRERALQALARTRRGAQ